MQWPYKLEKLYHFLRLPFAVQWRAYLVRLPWLVPRLALRVTSPEGPFPEVIQLPSRGRHKIPIFVFVPTEPGIGPAGHPVHIDFHGGGFIMGSCLEQAPWCAMVARQTGRIVLSVDYRKGPVDKFPAAVEDAEDVLAAVLDTEQRTAAGKLVRRTVQSLLRERAETPVLNADRISLSGFSSGGNLALNLVISVATDSGPWPSLLPAEGPPIPTLLFYPSFDSRQLPHERPRPAKMKADSGSWFSSLGSVLGPTYLSKEQRMHPRASPGLNSMTESLSKRARIQLVLPEIDTLAHQSEEWVQRMRREGLGHLLAVSREADMRHGWTQFPDAWLDENARRRKYAVFADSIDFIRNSESKRAGDI